jgi:hypothetical protein
VNSDFTKQSYSKLPFSSKSCRAQKQCSSSRLLTVACQTKLLQAAVLLKILQGANAVQQQQCKQWRVTAKVL